MHYPLLIVHYSLLIVHYSLLIVHYPQSDSALFPALFRVYTLISSLLIIILPVLFSLYYYFSEKKNGFFICEFNLLLAAILGLSLSWSCVSLGIFFSCAADFPSTSSYGAFTIFYLALFSLYLFAAFVLLLFHFNP